MGTRTIKFRHSYNIREGYNLIRISFPQFIMAELEGYLYLYPENNEPEKRIIFIWLDFV